MKTSNSIYRLPFTVYGLQFTVYRLVVLCATLLLFTSCYQPDVVMHTVVKGSGPDRLTREFSYSNVMPKEMRDSVWGKNRINRSQPLPECLNLDELLINSERTYIREGDTVTTTLKSFFENAEKMCEPSPLMLNGVRLRSKAKLKKHFRWFYTEYNYSETFFCVGDTFKLADTLYADKDIVNYWFTGEPNLVKGLNGAETLEKLNEIEMLITRWLNDNLFQVGFDFIVAHYDSIPNPPVSRERFVELHDSLENFLLSGTEDLLDIKPEEKFRKFFHSDAYAVFFDGESILAEELNKEFEKRLNIFCFNVPYTLTMPGKVTNTGKGTLQPDGTILYPFTGERLIPRDYTITATSQVINVWAYVVTLIGAILYIILLLVLLFRLLSEKVRGIMKKHRARHRQ